MLKRIFLFLAIMGPGIITANVDNDANGIATYSMAGSHFGYSLIIVLLFAAFLQSVIQDMCSRMACVTKKGLSDLIRENFGLKISFWIMLVLFLANLANTIGNFAGLAAGAHLLGIPSYLSLPVTVGLVWLIVVKGNYERVEKVFLFACVIYLTYIASAFMVQPPWKEVVKQSFTFSPQFNSSYFIMAIAIVGTTIAPWMQFFQQSAVRDKGLEIKDYVFARWDTYIGTLMMAGVAFFIIVSCGSTLYPKGIFIQSAEEAAQALAPLAGGFCTILFAIGLINAAIFSVSIIPLSTSYAICEALGWESGLGNTLKEAPAFYFVYAFMLVLSAGLILLAPNHLLLSIMVLSQTLNGILLPAILIAMLVLINNKKIMGTWVNTRMMNVISWAGTVVLIAASLTLLFTAFK